MVKQTLKFQDLETACKQLIAPENASRFRAPVKNDKLPALTYPIRIFAFLTEGVVSCPPSEQFRWIPVFELSFSLLDAALKTTAVVYKHRPNLGNSAKLNDALLLMLNSLKKANPAENPLISSICDRVLEHYKTKTFWHVHPILGQAALLSFVSKAARVGSKGGITNLTKATVSHIMEPIRIFLAWEHLKEEHVLDLFEQLEKNFSELDPHKQNYTHPSGKTLFYYQLHWLIFLESYELIFHKWNGALSANPIITEPLQTLFCQRQATQSIAVKGVDSTPQYKFYAGFRKNFEQLINKQDDERKTLSNMWLNNTQLKEILEQDLDQIKTQPDGFSLDLAYCLWLEMNQFGDTCADEGQLQKIWAYVLRSLLVTSMEPVELLRPKLLNTVSMALTNPAKYKKFKINLPSAISTLIKGQKDWIAHAPTSPASLLTEKISTIVTFAKDIDSQGFQSILTEVLDFVGYLTSKEDPHRFDHLGTDDLDTLRLETLRFATKCAYNISFMPGAPQVSEQELFTRVATNFAGLVKSVPALLQESGTHQKVMLAMAMISSLFIELAKKFPQFYRTKIDGFMTKEKREKFASRKILYHVPSEPELDAGKLRLSLKTCETLRDFWAKASWLLSPSIPYEEFTLFLIKDWLRDFFRTSELAAINSAKDEITYLLECGYTILTKINECTPKQYLELFVEWSHASLENPLQENKDSLLNVLQLVLNLDSSPINREPFREVKPLSFRQIFGVILACNQSLVTWSLFDQLLCMLAYSIDVWFRKNTSDLEQMETYSVSLCQLFYEILEQINWKIGGDDEGQRRLQKQKQTVAQCSHYYIQKLQDAGFVEQQETQTLKRTLLWADVGYKYASLDEQQLSQRFDLAEGHFQKGFLLRQGTYFVQLKQRVIIYKQLEKLDRIAVAHLRKHQKQGYQRLFLNLKDKRAQEKKLKACNRMLELFKKRICAQMSKAVLALKYQILLVKRRLALQRVCTQTDSKISDIKSQVFQKFYHQRRILSKLAKQLPSRWLPWIQKAMSELRILNDSFKVIHKEDSHSEQTETEANIDNESVGAEILVATESVDPELIGRSADTVESEKEVKLTDDAVVAQSVEVVEPEKVQEPLILTVNVEPSQQVNPFETTEFESIPTQVPPVLSSQPPSQQLSTTLNPFSEPTNDEFVVLAHRPPTEQA